MTRFQSKSTNELFLAVDAGGTKTTAWLLDLGADKANVILGRGRSSGGNPLSAGWIEATRAISDAAAQACGEAQLSHAPIGGAILSIAGAADTDVRDKLVAWAHATALAQRVAIVSDFLPVLAAGSPDCCGVALICGTGSSAFARNAHGRTARCGGWGYVLGDEGSGFAIGRAALRHTLHILEAKLQNDSLSRMLLDRLGAKSVPELTRVIYSSADLRAKIASVAPLVVNAAERGDSAAVSILDVAARDLAELAVRAAQAVELTEGPLAIAISGGVLVNAEALRHRLVAELKKLGPACTIEVVDEPLQGCVRLAAPEVAATLVEWQ